MKCLLIFVLGTASKAFLCAMLHAYMQSQTILVDEGFHGMLNTVFNSYVQARMHAASVYMDVPVFRHLAVVIMPSSFAYLGVCHERMKKEFSLHVCCTEACPW